MTAVNTNSKETLARLMATENLNVVHQNVQTASFNLKDRTLILPSWDEMTNETYDHLVGHEVGHALYTPEDKWTEAVRGSSAGFKTFLNVIEDARIERMMQDRFPGLRRSFIASYRKLLADGFFGGDLEKINSMKLVDRLNVYFKCGMTAGIEITRAEMQWVEAINSVKTFEDAIRVAQELYAYEKAMQEEAAEQQELEMQQLKAAGEEDTDDLTDPFFDEETDEEMFGDGEGDDEEEDDLDEDEDEDQMDGPAAPRAGGDVVAETVEKLEQNIRKEFSNTGIERINTYVNWNYDVSNNILPYKKVLGSIDPYQQEYSTDMERTHKKFLKNNKKTIDYLVKEFEMKKSAQNYSRAAVSSTGMIDTIKMNSYKYNDDIFRKITVVPDGKNHGLLMFVDWSGSMQNCLGNTIEQMLNLVMFCRQVNIPFQVYSFTSNEYVNRDWSAGRILNKNADEVAIDTTTLLCELFSNKMRSSEFVQMVKYMSLLVEYGRYSYRFFPTCLQMGSTPLNEAIILSKKMFDQFKKINRLDVVNMVFLTDGESNRMEQTIKYEDRIGTTYIRYSNSIVSKFIDMETKKQYRFNFNEGNSYSYNGAEETRILLTMLRENTGANVIGFRIFANKTFEVNQTLMSVGIKNQTTIDEIRKEMSKNKFIDIPGAGYTKFFGLFYKDLQITSSELNVKEDASKSELRRAFGKANKDRLISRVLLNKFVDLIA